ncbi:MAG: DUF6430 domain-containing protein [Treponema sp.]|jgi:hypothetical protein|nr:DUF6430 domain-containing protein [Treponema sp.]
MKKYSPFESPTLWKDSFVFGFVILGVIETAMSVLSVTLECAGNIPTRIGLVVAVYVVITGVIFFVKYRRAKSEITIDIRGINVTVKQGDIFRVDGWKLIPCNEYFDTQVDDVIIAKSSLNGKYIESLRDDDKEALKKAITTDDKSPLSRCPSPDGTKTGYELGTIKTFQDVMLLAFTRFNEQYEAHTNRAEYEHTLRTMWKEINRVYAGKPIYLPLLGSGISRFDDMATKPNAELLKCIICTLRTSTVTFNAPITILLTENVLKTINLYELKGVK